MEELLRTNDPVVLSFVGALLDESGIGHTVADQNMSVIEGTIGILPRRILVRAEELERARQLLAEAGLAKELPAAPRA